MCFSLVCFIPSLPPSLPQGGGGLFSNCSSLLAGDFKNVSSELLTQLFSLGGGNIETAVPDLKKVSSAFFSTIVRHVCDYS